MPISLNTDLLELSHRLVYRRAPASIKGLSVADLPTLLRRLRDKGDVLVPPRAILSSQAELAQKRGIRMMLSGEKDWPAALENLPQAPPLLFVAGELPSLRRCVAIVGSRRCSRQGREMARLLGRGLGASGITVASGLARGIDGEAHLGALERGKTFAVLAGGLDSIYPPEHRSLAVRIMESGALLSEFPPGVAPLPFHFPRRNRIIAALSQLTVVVEAGKKSGARITAQHAIDLGRNVGVVPGNPMNPAAGGSNQLLFDGGDVIRSVQDIMELLEWRKVDEDLLPWCPERCRRESVEDIEVLALRSGWSLARSIENLSVWERDGEVRRLGDGRFKVLE
jgi:DNA processing protein